MLCQCLYCIWFYLFVCFLFVLFLYRRGLEALVGFDLDHSILRNLQAEMAQGTSGAGLIREAQFLQAFRSLNRERLLKHTQIQTHADKHI